jgi:hypothetical protein
MALKLHGSHLGLRGFVHAPRCSSTGLKMTHSQSGR